MGSNKCRKQVSSGRKGSTIYRDNLTPNCIEEQILSGENNVNTETREEKSNPADDSEIFLPSHNTTDFQINANQNGDDRPSLSGAAELLPN